MNQMHLLSVNVGVARSMSGTSGEGERQGPWRSAIIKQPVAGPVAVRRLGIAGDQQADLRVHGGPDKALLAYSAEHELDWQRELDLPEIGPGGFGENLTVGGVAEEEVCLGDVWQFEEVTLELSQPRQPCWKLARRWDRPQLVRLVARSGRTGWYFRVLDEGKLLAGMTGTLLRRPYPDWPVSRANRVLFEKGFSPAQISELAAIPQLAESWKSDLPRPAHETGPPG
jgi:MOSC domain-containing protein YiiM